MGSAPGKLSHTTDGVGEADDFLRAGSWRVLDIAKPRKPHRPQTGRVLILTESTSGPASTASRPSAATAPPRPPNDSPASRSRSFAGSARTARGNEVLPVTSLLARNGTRSRARTTETGLGSLFDLIRRAPNTHRYRRPRSWKTRGRGPGRTHPLSHSLGSLRPS